MSRIASILLLAVATPAHLPAQGFEAKARALDGDTVAVDFRLLGVDAFERGQLCQRSNGCWACGKAAQDIAARLLRAGPADIRLTSSSSYGRPVATVSIDGIWANS